MSEIRETNGEAIVRMIRDQLPDLLWCNELSLDELQDQLCHSLDHCPAVDTDGRENCEQCCRLWLDSPYAGSFSLQAEPDGLFGPFAHFVPTEEVR